MRRVYGPSAGWQTSWRLLRRRQQSASDVGSPGKVDGQRQLDRGCAHRLVKQIVDRGLPFQLHSQARLHSPSLGAAAVQSAEGHGTTR